MFDRSAVGTGDLGIALAVFGASEGETAQLEEAVALACLAARVDTRADAIPIAATQTISAPFTWAARKERKKHSWRAIAAFRTSLEK